MHQDLIERYIYAVIKTLPTRMREDVERELHSLISDMLEERCQDMPSTEHDVLVVLTELVRQNWRPNTARNALRISLGRAIMRRINFYLALYWRQWPLGWQ